MDDHTIRPLADDYTVMYRSSDPHEEYCYSPGIAVLPSGRLVGTMDVGGPGRKSAPPEERYRGKVFVSDDQGKRWRHVHDVPFVHARPFLAGDRLYVLGHRGDLAVTASGDGGASWGETSVLTEGEQWHQSACNVWYAHGCVYLVMERRTTFDLRTWQVGELAPVLMRGRLDSDLTRRENWTFASELSFRDVMPGAQTDPQVDLFGVPFFHAPYPSGATVSAGRNCAPIGWLETNVVQILDPEHFWHDPTGRTFHLLARAHTGGTGYAALAKVTEQGASPGTGAMRTALEEVPSGRNALFLPCPGGQMRFHVLYDEPTERYWLLSTQATDSMRRAECLPADRYNLPNNERRRLQLHFSRNLVDWCFAGLVAVGPCERGSRHYASMAIDGEDLIVLSRSGDEQAHDAHNGNLITFHRIPRFRRLVY